MPLLGSILFLFFSWYYWLSLLALLFLLLAPALLPLLDAR
jgi:hypothetical protein